MIDRKKLVKKHNPFLTEYTPKSPLSVGNGEFAFTADITGLQTFYREQKAACVPLCTMSQWGWHSTPAGAKRDVYYRPDQVVKTTYRCKGRTVSYASEVQDGNEEIYHWLRQNPHRLNLIRVSFFWEGKEIHPKDIQFPEQELDLYSGILKSCFRVNKIPVVVRTVCAADADAVGFWISSAAIRQGSLTVRLLFPYGSEDITASDWTHPQYHRTVLRDAATIERFLDQSRYRVKLNREADTGFRRVGEHEWELLFHQEHTQFTLSFFPDQEGGRRNGEATYQWIEKNSREEWRQYFDSCGIVSFAGSGDPRAQELERRLILSLYLLKIQACGSAPPQETGLFCNSWYGKFHLEMFPWHCAWALLYQQQERIEKTLRWYRLHLPEARENAGANGYRGARWPKMVDRNGIDSPSAIAVLLIWQQPHIIYMLWLCRQAGMERERLENYWEVIEETADFMVDFTARNPDTGTCDLPAPLIPAQEEHDPRTTKNPAFELEYWFSMLHVAADLADWLGKDRKEWRETADSLAPMPQKDGLYLACESCPDTFLRYHKDHPSMTAALGFLAGHRVDRAVMRNTLAKILECWDFDSLWGWDFAMLAMTAVRLGEPALAIDILMMESPKNTYVQSGNNYQELRQDLPLYLPGNGALLLAVAMMVAGYSGCEEKNPGFPRNGMWQVQYENIRPYPY